MKRFKFAYVMKHFKNCIQIVLKSAKEMLEKYRNCQKRFIKEFIFSKAVGWRLAVLLIMIAVSFIFQGILFNFKLFSTAFKHLFSKRYPLTASNMFFSRVSEGEHF